MRLCQLTLSCTHMLEEFPELKLLPKARASRHILSSTIHTHTASRPVTPTPPGTDSGASGSTAILSPSFDGAVYLEYVT